MPSSAGKKKNRSTSLRNRQHKRRRTHGERETTGADAYCCVTIFLDRGWFSGVRVFLCFFFFNDTATTEIYTLPLHDALPIFYAGLRRLRDRIHTLQLAGG